MAILMDRPKSMLDIYKLLPEGTPIQLINNRFSMSPAPLFRHFDIIDNVVEVMKTQVNLLKNGRVIFAPVDVFLGDTNAVQPDIMFIQNENFSIIKENGIHGAPDIIVEVLSPGNKNDDLIKKKNVYETFGVKEYFIIDPADKSVIAWILKNSSFTEQKKQTGKFTSKILKAILIF